MFSAIKRNVLPTDLRVRSGQQNRTKMSDSSIIKVDKSSKSHINGTNKEHAISLILDAKSFGGRQQVFQHDSRETSCSMKFSIYVPELQSPNEKFHTVIFLSGIMCNEQNFLFKTGFQKYANQERLIVVGADTSPRKCSWFYITYKQFYEILYIRF